MKNLIFISLIFFFCFHNILSTKAQNNLEFNQVIIIDSDPDTVPSGKVWKIEAIFGEQVNVCLPVDCYSIGLYAFGIATGMYVNGILIPSTIRGFKTSHTRYTSSDCTTGSWCCGDISCNNKNADPNILPMWLPEGTIVKSFGSNCYISAIEFIVVTP